MARRKNVGFRFKVKKPRQARKFEFKQPVPEKKPEPPIGLIQGQTPGSVEEWRVANVLWRLGWKNKFIYQHPVFGGKRVRGGQVIDFLINTIPRPTPLYVNARYFHRRDTEEAFKLNQLQARMKGRWLAPVIIWDDEARTIDQAYHILLDKIGKA